MKRFTAFLLVVIMTALSLIACGNDEGEVMGADDPYKPEDVVMSTENFSYTRGELSIAFYQYCADFFVDSETVDFYNVDGSVSLKEQIYYDDVSWFDYFLDLSVEYMENVLLSCEAAKAAGIELSEEDLETVESAVRDFVRYAADYGYTEEEYFEIKFGADADREALRGYLQKEALAYRFQDSEVASYSFTDDELLKHAEKDWQNYKTINYISYMFDEDEDSNAKTAAEGLAAITDPAAFDSYIIDYMTNTLELDSELIKTDDCYHNYTYYDKYSEFSKWAFEEGGAEGTTYVKSNEVDGQYTVYLLTDAADLRADKVKNIRVLAVNMDKHETSAKALTYAEDLLESWKEGEATEESFELLVKENSDDDVMAGVGGLVDGVAAGDELPEGLEAWLYSGELAVGNTGVFKGSGAYYIVYYRGEGDLKWKVDAKAALTSDKYSESHEEIAKKYKVDKFEEIMESLNA